MPSDEQRTLEMAEDLVQRAVTFVRGDDFDGLMSLFLRVSAALISAEARIAALQARLDAAEPQEDGDPEMANLPDHGDPAHWSWHESEAETPEEPELTGEDLSQDFVMRSGPDVLKRCLDRAANQPRQNSYLSYRGPMRPDRSGRRP
jgi:hypothetical protein